MRGTEYAELAAFAAIAEQHSFAKAKLCCSAIAAKAANSAY